MSIDDTYRVERVLARGETGVTELVTIDGAGPFVRKKMEAKPANRRVWAALGACESPRLPHVEASYELPDQFVVVYDFVPGETLESLVARRGALAANEAVQAARGICEACAELHAHGVIHRDITPTNVILSADGAHLIDLGIARMRVEGASKDTTSLGTWGYASPEQYGFAQTDARSDVYSIGRVLGYLLTGVRAGDDDFDAALANACQGEAAALGRVVERACAFEPSARYQSAGEMAAALAGAENPRDDIGGSTPASTSANFENSAGGEARLNANDAIDATDSRGATTKATSTDRGSVANVGAGAAIQTNLTGPTSTPDPVCRLESATDPDQAPDTGEEAAVDSAATSGTLPTTADQPSASPNANRTRKANRRRAVIIAAIVLLAAAAVALGIAYATGAFSTPASSPDSTAVSKGTTAPSATSASSSASSTDSSSADADAATGTQATQNPLEVVESGWSLDSINYVSCAFIIKNTSDKHVRYPTVHITGRDAEGNIVFTDEEVLNIVAPGESLSASAIAGNGDGGDTPATVDITVEQPSSDDIVAAGKTATFSVNNVRESRKKNEAVFTGEVTTETDATGDEDGDVAITVIFRDADGKIIGGDTDYATRPAVGASAPFQLDIVNIPDYATYEVSAVVW